MMKLLTEIEFNIKPLEEPQDETSPQKSNILLNGQITAAAIEGIVLEACIKWHDFYLVFLTDDIPHEDMLHIHLLDHKLKTLDSATIGGMYTTGNFTDVELVAPNRVNFNFIGGTRWHIDLLSHPQRCLPIISTPKGVYKKSLFSRHFKISGEPLPETI
ncbi:hypothetical protein [Thalassomonas sp. RHCl1]|uniref:hypothetical protein n=1 Tax=Thalassomonas sp. RHCl1 TaxID=2995320 RepID=UPI00248C0C2C|nr:hypothetical protein [Thalassomonas sp. RHCl1]